MIGVVKCPCAACDGEGWQEVPLATFAADWTSHTKRLRCDDCDGTGDVIAECQHPKCQRYAAVDCQHNPGPDGHYDDRYLCTEHYADWRSTFDDELAEAVADVERDVRAAEAAFTQTTEENAQ